MVLFVLVVVICVMVFTLFATEGSRPSGGSGKTVWRNDKKMYICYRVKPPRFRNVSSSSGDSLSSCGFCKHYENGKCKKYGVEYAGEGSAVATVCDDLASTIGDLFG